MTEDLTGTATVMTFSDGEHNPVRRGKRARKESSSELSIEEVFPDEVGYDGDVEALFPDGYEEPESDTEILRTPKRKFHSIDEELASRMRHLGSEGSGTHSPATPVSMKGRKRRSLHDDLFPPRSDEQSDLEVMEVPTADGSAKSPPRKRRRQSKPSSSNHKSDVSVDHSTQERSLYISTDVDDANDANDVMDMT